MHIAVASEPRPSLFTRSVIARARAECNCVWANFAINGEFAHTQLHSARAHEITDRVNGDLGLGSEAKVKRGNSANS